MSFDEHTDPTHIGNLLESINLLRIAGDEITRDPVARHVLRSIIIRARDTRGRSNPNAAPQLTEHLVVHGWQRSANFLVVRLTSCMHALFRSN